LGPAKEASRQQLLGLATEGRVRPAETGLFALGGAAGSAIAGAPPGAGVWSGATIFGASIVFLVHASSRQSRQLRRGEVS
jgi:hypothetical protein